MSGAENDAANIRLATGPEPVGDDGFGLGVAAPAAPAAAVVPGGPAAGVGMDDIAPEDLPQLVRELDALLKESYETYKESLEDSIASDAPAAAAAGNAMQMEEQPQPRRTSKRLRDNYNALVGRESAKRLRQEAEAAAAQAAAAQAAAQAAAAVTATRNEVKTTVKAVFNRMDPETRDGDFLSACGVLLPALMGGLEPTVAVSETPLIKFTDVFQAGSEVAGLVQVCNLIYGKLLTGRIQRGYTGSEEDMRKFFDISKAPFECKNVLDPTPTLPVQTHCWLCGAPALLEMDCEHRLAVLLALCFIGIYDPILHGILHRMGRAKEYLDLLQFEYARAHAVCNRKKADIPVLYAKVESGNVVVSTNKPKIQAMLTAIAAGGNYDITKVASIDQVRTEMAKATQWDGNFRTPTLTIPKETRLGERGPVIEGALKELVDKLNANPMTAKELCIRISRGFLLRAIIIAPAPTKEEIYATLPPAYQQLLAARTPSGGRRRNRRGTVRRLRGGAVPTDALVGLYDIIEYIGRSIMLTYIGCWIDSSNTIPYTGDALDCIHATDVQLIAYIETFTEIINSTFSILQAQFFTSGAGISNPGELVARRLDGILDTMISFLSRLPDTPSLPSEPQSVAAAASPSGSVAASPSRAAPVPPAKPLSSNRLSFLQKFSTIPGEMGARVGRFITRFTKKNKNQKTPLRVDTSKVSSPTAVSTQERGVPPQSQGPSQESASPDSSAPPSPAKAPPSVARRLFGRMFRGGALGPKPDWL